MGSLSHSFQLCSTKGGAPRVGKKCEQWHQGIYSSSSSLRSHLGLALSLHQKLQLKLAFFFFLRFFIYLCLERGEGREKERERNINVGCLSHTPNWGSGLQLRHVPWLRNQTYDSLVRRLVLNPLSHTSQDSGWLSLSNFLLPQFRNCSFISSLQA